MSRKIFIIIIGIILGAVLIYIFVVTRTPKVNPDGTTKSALSSIFPFLGNSATPPVKTVPAGEGTAGTTTPPVNPTPATPSDLKKISTRVVAGFAMLPPGTVPVRIEHSATGESNAPGGTVTVPALRLVEAGTGYVYTLDAGGQNEVKSSDTLIARALDAFFADNGATVAVRYIKDDNKTVATFVGALQDPAGDASIGSLKGSFFPDNIVDMIASPDQKNFFYVTKTATGSIGMTISTSGANKKQIFTSPLSEWLVGYTKGGATVTTKASSDTPGYIYSVTANGTLSKIVGNVNGLTTLLSPDGKMMLYSLAENGGLHLYAKSLVTGAASDLNLSTLPEKCVWSKDSVTAYCGAPESLPPGTYPDDWYQGTVHLSDSLWRVGAASGAVVKLAGDTGNFLDVIKPALDTDEHYLVFVNKNDGSLWSLNLAP